MSLRSHRSRDDGRFVETARIVSFYLVSMSPLAFRLLPYGLAFVDAYASALTLQLADAVNTAAMRTDRAFRPYAGFNPRVSCSFVLERLALDYRFAHDRRFPFMNQRYQTR